MTPAPVPSAAFSTNSASSAAARLASFRSGMSCAPACPPSPAQQTRAFCDPPVQGSCAPCTQHPSPSGASTQGYRSRARATTRGAWGHSRVHSLVLREALPVQALAGLAPGTTNVGALADLRCAHVHSWAGGAPEKWMRSAAGAAMAVTTPICLPSASSSGPCGRGSPAARSVGVHSTRSSAKEGPGPGASFRRASGAPALASSQGVPRHTAQAAAQEGCFTRAGSAPARCVAPQTREGRPASAVRCAACHRSRLHRSRLQRVRWIASGYAPPVHDAFSDVGCRPGRYPKEDKQRRDRPRPRLRRGSYKKACWQASRGRHALQRTFRRTSCWLARPPALAASR